MRQWRILHSESSRGWGGQEVRVFAELEWMRRRGHWVALAAPETSAIARHAREAGLTFYPINTHKIRLPWEVLRLSAWMRRNRIEVVNTHSSNDGWLAGTAARLAGLTLIRSRHIEVDYPNAFWSGLGFRTLPHHVLTTSQRIADRLTKELDVPSERVTCVATGVDLARFDFRLPGTLREELGVPQETQLVGMISVLRSWKGHETFLQASGRVFAATAKPVHFVIAGDGPGREELKAKIAALPFGEKIHLLGHRADVPSLLASLDVLVLPSYAHEGIPQIVLQAQAMKRPVVASRIGGIPEVVEDGVTGLLVEPRDAETLARKIVELLEDEGLRIRLGDAARTRIEKEFSLDAMGQRLLGLYENLSGAKA